MAALTETKNPRVKELLQRSAELKDIDGILGLLSWDEETYAPPGARAMRGQQTATLEAIRHQRTTDPRLGELISALVEDSTLEVEERALVERVKRKRDLATKIPESLVKELAETRSLALDAWQRSRASRQFGEFEPYLDKTIQLQRAKADALGWSGGEKYDPLLDEYEPGMKTSRLRPVLEELRRGLVPIVDAILGARQKPKKDFLTTQKYDVEAQWQFTLKLLDDLGFSFDNGRQDRSAHPFTCNCSDKDVRVTTRLFADNPLSAIFSTIHECGHGLYEQGFRSDIHRTALAEAPSAGIHESQSRLWENVIGRSRPFWNHYFPLFQRAFPAQTAGVDAEGFYRAVNFVEASPIRVEADEVTYNLHILVRFELELAMIEGQLAVRDLPAAWNEKMQKYLGFKPAHDGEGCLQDIHWGWGSFGYFPTYSVGNLYAAQLVDAYEREHPAVWQDVGGGRFGLLLAWLRDKVHRQGHLKPAETVIKEATGEGLSVTPFLNYLARKYGEIYSVSLPSSRNTSRSSAV
jgi:carboxypeptidase Taq